MVEYPLYGGARTLGLTAELRSIRNLGSKGLPCPRLAFRRSGLRFHTNEGRMCFSPITERNSEGWQKASLTLRLTLREIQPPADS